MTPEEAHALGDLLESIDGQGVDVRDVDIGKEQAINPGTVFTTPKPRKTVFTLTVAVDADIVLNGVGDESVGIGFDSDSKSEGGDR